MEAINYFLGIGTPKLIWWQMVIRGLVVFILAISLIRMGGVRIFGKYTAFDIVIGIVLGSLLSRAITGNSPFYPTLLVTVFLTLLHLGVAHLAYHSKKFGKFIKGEKQILVKNGTFQQKCMKKNRISEDDLLEALRSERNIRDLKEVKRAYLERNGEISVITHKDEKSN